MLAVSNTEEHGQTLILEVSDRTIVKHRLNVIIEWFGSGWGIVMRPKAWFFGGGIIAGENADHIQRWAAISQRVTRGILELLRRLRTNVSRHPSFVCHTDFLSFGSLRLEGLGQTIGRACVLNEDVRRHEQFSVTLISNGGDAIRTK
jgi:hypothetical protein